MSLYLSIEYGNEEETNAQTTGTLKMFTSSKQNAGSQLSWAYKILKKAISAS
jgi:hypothetical protein